MAVVLLPIITTYYSPKCFVGLRSIFSSMRWYTLCHTLFLAYFDTGKL